MIETLSSYRPGIEQMLERLLRGNKHLSRVNSWGEDLIERLFLFASRGKLIRGSLVSAGAKAFGREPAEAEFLVGAVMELIQSFLLIHDDIMDQDAIRRGAPAVYEQYRRLGAERGYSDNSRFSESMGICAGDVAVLVAFEALSQLDVDPVVALSIHGFVAAEIADVGVAQMADVAHGHQQSEPTEREILEVYRLKTGRYTFSVPLMLGAMLAGAPQESIEAMSRWGELQGVIFQLRDDELGLMGDTEQTGKPAGSDVTSDKKTIHRAVLLERLKANGNVGIKELFGACELSSSQIDAIRTSLRETGTLDDLSRRVKELGEQASPLLANMSGLTGEGRAALTSLAHYNASRMS